MKFQFFCIRFKKINISVKPGLMHYFCHLLKNRFVIQISAHYCTVTAAANQLHPTPSWGKTHFKRLPLF